MHLHCGRNVLAAYNVFLYLTTFSCCFNICSFICYTSLLVHPKWKLHRSDVYVCIVSFFVEFCCYWCCHFCCLLWLPLLKPYIAFYTDTLFIMFMHFPSAKLAEHKQSTVLINSYFIRFFFTFAQKWSARQFRCCHLLLICPWKLFAILCATVCQVKIMSTLENCDHACEQTFNLGLCAFESTHENCLNLNDTMFQSFKKKNVPKFIHEFCKWHNSIQTQSCNRFFHHAALYSDWIE